MLADAIATGLRRRALAVDVAYDGDAALERLAVNDYDVLVLDRDLPKVHGDQVCQAVVASGGTTRVLMLTAADAVRDRIAGLNLGADDYLPKPFVFAELIARIQALGRRTQPATPPTLRRSGLTFEPAHRRVERDGVEIRLSPKEFALLHELLRANGAVVSSEHLLEKVWDENVDPFTNTLRVTMLNLRRKLGLPPIIQTVPGVGYQLP
jgi:DNA-binding response OmpR family regulator